MVGWIRFYGAKPPASITVKRFRGKCIDIRIN
jgi:hypothetical protein